MPWFLLLLIGFVLPGKVGLGQEPAEEATGTKQPAEQSDSSPPVPQPEALENSAPPVPEPEDENGTVPEPKKSNETSGAKKSFDPKDKLFGRYKVRLGVGVPTFDQGMKCFKKLYGTENPYPTMGVDIFAFDWYVTLGVSFRFNYFTQKGHAGKNTGSAEVDPKKIDCDAIEVDRNEEAQLTLVPLQGLGIMQFTPFNKKWLVFDVWGGLGYTYFQETRLGTGSGSKTAGAPTNGAKGNDEADSALTNKGSKREIVFGGSVNILLNKLDERSVASMNESLALGAIYLAPFVEVARTVGEDPALFGRTTMGLVFVFESSR